MKRVFRFSVSPDVYKRQVLLYEGHSLKIKIAANERKTVQLEQQIEEENQRTADIRELQEYMQSDEYLEKTAKEKLGLVKENEIIFKEQAQ